MRAAALIAATAMLVAAGCGGKTKTHVAPHGPAVTLDLKGGSGSQMTACGSQHHYTQYARGAAIEFAGTVKPIPLGRWKVKLKIKMCRGSNFVPVTKVRAARDKKTGAFSGRLPRLKTGAYFARAQLYVNGSQSGQSDKRHLAIR